MTDEALICGIATLADATRRALYDHLVASPEPVSREEAARAVGISQQTARFHLDRLEAEGLVDVEFRRLSGRTGPGAGRPAKLYRRGHRELAVSLPQRTYDLAGAILADAMVRIAAGSPLPQAIDAAATARAHAVVAGRVGRAADAPSPGDPHDSSEALVDTLTACGFEPRQTPDGIRLVNCPFHALAQEQTELVCGLNRSFVQGLVEAHGCDDTRATLTPTPGECCVTCVQSDDLDSGS